MSDWTLGFKYDYRFASYMVQMKHGEELSPMYKINTIDLLSNIPAHELQAIMQPEYANTEGEDDIENARIRLLESVDWKGKVCLDVGGYDGFAAKIAYDRGTSRAICLDNYQYEHYGWKKKKKDGVEYVRGDFMDFSQMSREGYYHAFNDESGVDIPHPDVIIFFNVLYHLKNPWAGLEHLHTLLKPDGEMLLCTLFRYHEGAWMYVYEEKECNPSDSTVYFGPSIEALERLLKHTGWNFEQYALAYDRVLYRCKPVENFVPSLAAEGYARS